MDKAKVLFILHLPPPVHGAAKVGEFIWQSERLNSSFDCDFINLQTSRKLTDTGKGGLSKLHRFLSLYTNVFSALFTKQYQLCYMTLNSKGAAFYKEMVVVFFLKLFGEKIVYHFHNKGVSISQNRVLDNLLYRFAFKNTKASLLPNPCILTLKNMSPPKMCFIAPMAFRLLIEIP